LFVNRKRASRRMLYGSILVAGQYPPAYQLTHDWIFSLDVTNTYNAENQA